MKNLSNELLVNMLANDHSLSSLDKKSIDDFLGSTSELQAIYQEKIEQKKFIGDLTPHFTLSKKMYGDILLEINDINKKVFDLKEDNILQKSLKFLDRPIFTIRF